MSSCLALLREHNFLDDKAGRRNGADGMNWKKLFATPWKYYER